MGYIVAYSINPNSKKVRNWKEADFVEIIGSIEMLEADYHDDEYNKIKELCVENNAKLGVSYDYMICNDCDFVIAIFVASENYCYEATRYFSKIIEK